MATEEYQLGSIADMIDKTGSKRQDSTPKGLKRKLSKKGSSVKKSPANSFKIDLDSSLKTIESPSQKMPIKMLKTLRKQHKTKVLENEETNENGDGQEEQNGHDEDNNEKESNAKNQEKQSRTLFVGNLPANFPMKNLKKTLQPYGKVISIRIRCVAPAKVTLSKKVALLSNQVNPNKKTVNAYVVFKEKDSVQKALELNGQSFEGCTIQVDSLDNDRVYDHSLSLFLGNLSFKTNEDELRDFFKDCGQIKSIRIVRDGKTGMGKGFGYVNFQSKDSVVLAMEKNGQMFKNREIRIKPYKYSPAQDKASSTMPKSSSKSVEKISKKSNPIGSSFQGEKSIMKMKKLMKKSLKSRLKESKMMKQKKTIAQIMTNKRQGK